MDRNLIAQIALLSAVSVLNVALNFAVRSAASSGASWRAGLLSPHGLLALAVGTGSFLCLFAVYRSGLNVARGILLAGAGSIVFGSLLASLAFGHRLHWSEWLLLVTISGFYTLRWYFAA